LVEVLLALALFALVVAGISGGLLYANSMRAGINARLEARLAAEDCIAVVRGMRDADGIDALPIGDRSLQHDDAGWALVPVTADAFADVSVSQEGTIRRVLCAATRGDTNPYTRTLETLLAQ
jgi:hypothetical protein